MKSAAAGLILLVLSGAPACADGYGDFNAGIEFQGRGDWSGSIPYFSQALAAGDLPAHLAPVAYYDRGLAYERLRQSDLAKADFDQALKLKPDYLDALVGRSHILSSERRYADAVTDDTAAIQAAPYKTSLYTTRAAVYELTGQTDAALQDLATVLARYPNEEFLHVDRGVAYWDASRFDEAAADFKEAHDLEGKDAYPLFWLVLSGLKTGRGNFDLKGESEDVDLDTWPGPIVHYFLGNATSDDVIKKAAEDDGDGPKGETCEAAFYIGEWNVLHKDVASGKPLLQKAVDVCPVDYIELRSAVVELKRLP